MKKLITAIFALSAITAFANNNIAEQNITVKAVISAPSKLQIIDERTGENVEKFTIDHGQLDKQAYASGSKETNISLKLKRDNSDPILIKDVDNVSNKISITYDKAPSLFLDGSTQNPAIATTLSDDLSANVAKINYATTEIPFTMTSTITSEEILKAKAGSYSKVVGITITVTE